MDLIDRSKFIDDMKELYSDHDFDSREIHFSLEDLMNNLDCKEYEVDAIPIEWIKEWTNKYPELVSETAFAWMIEDWEKEQEEQNENKIYENKI